MAGVKSLVASLVAGAALVASPVSHAEETRIIPNDFPPGFHGLYFGESVKSAKRKCASLEVKSKPKASEVFGLCTIDGTTFMISFSRRGKLENFSWDISNQEFDQCAKDILARDGVAGRSEDKDGNEQWTTHWEGSGTLIGAIWCSQSNSGRPYIAYMGNG
jgi:hypothetical protein